MDRCFFFSQNDIVDCGNLMEDFTKETSYLSHNSVVLDLK